MALADLISTVRRSIPDSMQSRIALNQLKKLDKGPCFSWFTPPDTLSLKSANRHHGSYVIICTCEDGSNVLVNVVKDDQYKSSHFRVKTSDRASYTDTIIRRLLDENIEQIWDCINNCDFIKDDKLIY
jgi:hypothetical protein